MSGPVYAESEAAEQTDPQAVYEMLLTAAEAGHVEAQYKLARWFVVVKQDKGQALKWLIIARSLGHPFADQGIQVYKEHMDHEQFMASQKMALAWIEKRTVLEK